MKIMVSENVTHFHEVDLSEELDVEQIIETVKSTGYKAQVTK